VLHQAVKEMEEEEKGLKREGKKEEKEMERGMIVILESL
jgi:hypothetical protein